MPHSSMAAQFGDRYWKLDEQAGRQMQLANNGLLQGKREAGRDAGDAGR